MITPAVAQATVLIVDDDNRTQRLIQKYLEPHGYKLVLAHNGEQALEKIRELVPDIILLDILMPTVDGFEVCQAIKQDPATSDIPVIFLSAMQNTDDKVKAFAVGGVDYIVKPVAQEELLARLGTHLGLLAARRELTERNRLLSEKIRQHQATEQALKESQVLFQAVFDNSAMCVSLLDINGNYLKVNAKCLELLGYTQREMLRLSCLRLTHPDYVALSREAMEQLKRGEKPWCNFDKQFIRKDKSLLWAGYWLAPLFDSHGQCSAFICMITDLSERKRVETMLRKLSRAVEQSHNSIIITDLKGTIEFVNPAFCQATGYSNAEVMGQNPRLFKSGEHAPEFYRHMWQTLKSGDAWRGELINRRKNGELFTELATISPIKDERGVMTHYVAVKEDISQLKAAEAALEQAILNAEQARRIAESANIMKSRFLATMSHEIRTPMNSIIGFTEMLGEQMQDPQQREYLEIIRNSGKALLNLINDILDLSKIEAGKLKLECAPVDLHEILRDVPRLFTPNLQGKDVNLLVDLAEDLPALLILDDQRMRQTLLNLISNAIKFTEHGHIKISAWYDGPSPQGRGASLGFSVEDTGIGIPPEQCDTVFEAFEQQRDQRTNQFGGTGLGLTITKRLVELMGGTITLDSAVDRGSTFRVQFHGMHVPLLKQERQPAEVGGLRFSPAQLLLCSAHAEDSEALAACLESYGLNVQRSATLAELHAQLAETGAALALLDTQTQLTAAAADKLLGFGLPLVVFELPRKDSGGTGPAAMPIVLAKPVGTLDLLHVLMRFLPHTLPAGKQPQTSLAPLPEALALRLKEEFLPRWRSLNENSSFNTLEKFGSEIQALAEEYQYLPLQVWGQRLNVQAVSFDVDKVFATLAEFETLIAPYLQ